MAQNRANIAEGQAAYVGDLRFTKGQLLPEGTVEYQVKGWFFLEDDERITPDQTGIAYSFTVPVGTPKKIVAEATERLIGEAWSEGVSKKYLGFGAQMELLGDIIPGF